MSSRQLAAALAGVWMLAVGVRAGALRQTPVPQPAAPPAAAPAADRSTLAGVYTEKQAEAGADIFGSLCASCHKASDHAGAPFRLRWNGATLAELFALIGETMPKDDPESLTSAERAQVVAYLLKVNGLPAGKTDLPTDPQALAKIKIELPKDKAPN